jgi:hypothetical protein
VLLRSLPLFFTFHQAIIMTHLKDENLLKQYTQKITIIFWWTELMRMILHVL